MWLQRGWFCFFLVSLAFLQLLGSRVKSREQPGQVSLCSLCQVKKTMQGRPGTVLTSQLTPKASQALGLRFAGNKGKDDGLHDTLSKQRHKFRLYDILLGVLQDILWQGFCYRTFYWLLEQVNDIINKKTVMTQNYSQSWTQQFPSVTPGTWEAEAERLLELRNAMVN